MVCDFKKIIHVCTKKTSQGSRIFSQLKYSPGLIHIEDHVWPSLKLIRFILFSRGNVFIFHQQVKLISLLLCWVLVKTTLRKHIVVYDMHDLAEQDPRMRITGKAFFFVSIFIEWILARTDVRVITVSSGLARLYKQRTGICRNVLLVYNIPPEEPRNNSQADRLHSRRLVYFGQVSPERISLTAIEALQNRGFAIDIYGYFSERAVMFKESLLRVIEAGGGRYFGRYRADDTLFLSNYLGCILIYESNKENIKYCLPNKLFQSLDAGLLCVVSDNLIEACELFRETKFVVSVSEIGIAGKHLPGTELLKRKLKSLRIESRDNFIEVTS